MRVRVIISPIEWCIREPILVCFYDILHFHQHNTNILNIHIYNNNNNNNNNIIIIIIITLQVLWRRGSTPKRTSMTLQ